jgi:hypothetical protein
MRLGTTPTLTFKLPFEVSMLSNAKATFRQGDIRLEKKLGDFETTENTLTIRLTQEETFLFRSDSQIKVQLRVVTLNGDALASDIFNIFVSECLDNEVLM